MIKCEVCKLDNEDGSNFCARCGHDLHRPPTILEKYPEMDLRPGAAIIPKLTSVITKQFFVVIGVLAIVAIIGFLLYRSSEYSYHEGGFVILMIDGYGAFLVALSFAINYLLSGRLKKFDYVSYRDFKAHKGRNFIVMRNGKYGLQAAPAKARIKPIYDQLEWKVPGEVLIAQVGEESFLVDVNGKKLL